MYIGETNSWREKIICIHSYVHVLATFDFKCSVLKCFVKDFAKPQEKFNLADVLFISGRVQNDAQETVSYEMGPGDTSFCLAAV